MNEVGIIESGVPVPKTVPRRQWQGRRLSKRSFPHFREMKPKNSVVEDAQGYRAFRNYAWKHGWGYTTQKIGSGLFRCWRLA